ncbi:MAG: hypothetical protein N3B16_09580 [Candidatus Aminicenantes bacterium]|nr:hypothetical protein [Candidatus Aminicenantes bacterium]
MAEPILSTEIKESDLLFLERELEKEKRPFSLEELAERLVFMKTADQREQLVYRYDPACRYEVGDLIYKEYDEYLPIGNKQTEYFQGAVVLKVIKKTYIPSYNSEILEVDYTGGGPFRRYMDYMKKKNAPVLLPSNVNGAGLTPEIIRADEDPRQSTLPITEKDLKIIIRNLKAALFKSPKFFSWNNRWQLVANQMIISEEKVKEIEAYLREINKSIKTEDLVRNFYQLEPSHPHFELHCLCLNYVLEKKYKKEFILVSVEGWGKWLLKSLLNSWLEGLPLAVEPVKLPPLEIKEKPQLSFCSNFPYKTYLTWREILSGAVKIPRHLHRELGSSREFLFVDPEEGQSFTVYFYPQPSILFGFKKYFEENAIPQGTSLTLEKKGAELFHCRLKRGKKRIAAIKLSYDPKTDKLIDLGEELSTLVTPNRILYLERDTLNKLFSLYPQRNELDLHGLLALIFKNFGEGQTAFSLHYLRAYHLVDILKPTTPEDVETVLLNSPEFTASEKGKGIFVYREPIAPSAEILIMPPVVQPILSTEREVREETKPEERAISPSEITSQPSEIESLGPPAQREIEPAFPRSEVVTPSIREKPLKKPKIRPDLEKFPKTRKSERKVIEERIEFEESEQEALIAIKAKEEIGGEEIAIPSSKVEKPVEEIKPPLVSEKPTFSLFAEKLKSALQKKDSSKK